jgi:hypothetical protein
MAALFSGVHRWNRLQTGAVRPAPIHPKTESTTVADRQSSDTTPSEWRGLGVADPDTLRGARLSLHHAVQLIASFGQSLLAAREDDSHRAMTWSEGSRSFQSDETSDGLSARLIVSSLSVEVWREGARLGSLDLRGRRPSEALAWMANLLSDAHEGGTEPMAWPEYDLPEQPGGPDSPLEPDHDSLEELAAWYGSAQRSLAELLGALHESSAIRCWPHHFDLATLLTFPGAGADGGAAYIGIGFSPGDDAIPRPYFYVNGWPAPDADELPPLSGPGAWHTEGWVGAVLRAGDIVAKASASEREQTVKTFLTTAVDAMRTAVLATR